MTATDEQPDIEPKPRRHRWDNDREQRIAGDASNLPCNVRVCGTCGMRKITMLPPHGFPWHEWLTAEGQRWSGEATPPCLVQADNVVAA